MSRLFLYITLSCFVVCVTCSEINDIGINGFAASRSLLAAKPTESPSRNGTLYNLDGCTMLYTRGLTLKYMNSKLNGDLYDFDTTTVIPEVHGSCQNTTSKAAESVLDVAYTGLTGNLTKFSMKMIFNASESGEWKLEKLTVSVTCSKGSVHCNDLKDFPFDASFIASQRGFSYHCSHPKRIVAEGSNKNESTFYIYFNKLQVQPFNIVKGRFSYADDCVGFFSGGIWSGLFVTLLLTLIFAYGIIMINNINVTDRFDDPKGPGIQVNVQE